jgi:hypothetical protein
MVMASTLALSPKIYEYCTPRGDHQVLEGESHPFHQAVAGGLFENFIYSLYLLKVKDLCLGLTRLRFKMPRRLLYFTSPTRPTF